MSSYNPGLFEKKWQDLWQDRKTFAAEKKSSKKKFYVLDMFPYPSGEGLHVGHPLGYIASDVLSKYKKMTGHNVLHPMGFDAFGLPAEQYAIQTGQHPEKTTQQNIFRYKDQLKKIGLGYDWSREVCTSNPEYYKWTQYIFSLLFNSWYDKNEECAKPIEDLEKIFQKEGNLKIKKTQKSLEEVFTSEEWKNFSFKRKEEILEKYRLAYRAETTVNWCEALGTVLSNDEVKDGFSERGGFPVEQKEMMQWMLRTSIYAERLLQGLDNLDWSKSIKETQKNWIGKSQGAEITFKIKNISKEIRIFTTRAETIFGVTYIAISPNHELLNILKDENILSKIKILKNESQKKETEKLKGIFTGLFAEHPISGELLPIWVADYVLEDYGTGAVMAVPSDDERDKCFAGKYNLPVKKIIEDEVLINSEFLNGETTSFAREKILDYLEEKNIGERKTSYKIRDAIFGRQRYWGEPIPVSFSDEGFPKLLSKENLPLLLPDLKSFEPSPDGRSPLAKIKNWKIQEEKLETDTMPGWAASSWYFFKYMNENKNDFIKKEDQGFWKNVDLYIGGAEHATGHLIYSRFLTKFLFDRKIVSVDEPFMKLVNQGMILGKSAWIFRINNTNKFISADQKNNYETIPVRISIEFVEDSFVFVEKLKNWRKDFESAEFIKNNSNEFLSTREVEKMSKSKFNTLTPDAIIEKYSADTLRLYTLFLGPLEDTKPWDTNGITGVYKFLHKFWSLFFDENNEMKIFSKEKPSKSEEIIVHTTIKKVTLAIESMGLNTAVSAFMICNNDLLKIKCNNHKILSDFLKLLSPFAPHVCEELWSLMKNKNSIFEEDFPKWNEKILEKKEIEYPVSINGKKKISITVDVSLDKKNIEELVMKTLKEKLQNKNFEPKKIIIVPNRIINVVV